MRPEGYKQAPLFISDNGASKGVSRVLLTEQQINARVKELGQTETPQANYRGCAGVKMGRGVFN